MDPESFRKSWNQGQAELRQALESGSQPEKAIELFLRQHGVLHTAAVSRGSVNEGVTWSYADAILAGLPEAQIRRIPPKGEHSIAWLIWHLARIEDVTMNLLIEGSPQLFVKEGWQDRLGVLFQNTGNEMQEPEMVELSETVQIVALMAYRAAVGARTREIVLQLTPEALGEKVDPARLQQVRQQGAVGAAGQGLLDYWGKRTIAGLLLMPPTRHNFIHLNEAWRIR